jgi:hypothetical protein
LTLVIWAAAASVVIGAGALTARHHAAAAADLAALAAASALADSMVGITGPLATSAPAESRSIACRAAASVASANDARLVRCEVDDRTVVVEAAVELPGIARFVAPGGAAEALARAGPG